MMEFIEPLGVDSVAAFAMRVEDADIVEIAFGNDPRLAAQVRRLGVKTVAKFGENVAGAKVENFMDRIQPQRIDVILGEPIESVVDHKTADSIAERAIEVHGASPGRPILVGVVGRELR